MDQARENGPRPVSTFEVRGGEGFEEGSQKNVRRRGEGLENGAIEKQHTTNSHFVTFTEQGRITSHRLKN